MEEPQITPLIKVESEFSEVLKEENSKKLKAKNFEDLALQEDLRLAIIDIINQLKTNEYKD